MLIHQAIAAIDALHAALEQQRTVGTPSLTGTPEQRQARRHAMRLVALRRRQLDRSLRALGERQAEQDEDGETYGSVWYPWHAVMTGDDTAALRQWLCEWLPEGWDAEPADGGWTITCHGTPMETVDCWAAAREAAWLQAALEALSVPPQAAEVRALCQALAERLVDDYGVSERVRDGQQAAARLLRVDPRTLRRWVAGTAAAPWAAMELLRLHAAAILPLPSRIYGATHDDGAIIHAVDGTWVWSSDGPGVSCAAVGDDDEPLGDVLQALYDGIELPDGAAQTLRDWCALHAVDPMRLRVEYPGRPARWLAQEPGLAGALP